MPTYQYKARERDGRMVEGVMAADSERAVAEKLAKVNRVPVVIRPAKEESGQSWLDTVLTRFKGVGYSDLNIFTRQLFILQRAGLPLLSSLAALKRQVSNHTLQDIIEQISREVESGSTLSKAMANFPRVFDGLYVSMIRSGEVSGKLVEVLERLARLGEHEEKIQRQVKAAMRYPTIVVCALVLAFIILISFVVPRFANLYAQFETALPLPTRVLIALNFLFTRLWWLMLMAFAGVVVAWRSWVRTPAGRAWWDDIRLKLPVFGPLHLKMIMSRFSRITGTLMQSGVPLLQILDLVAEAVGNATVSRVMQRLKASVNEGRGMSGPMQDSGLFPPIVLQMVAVGEQAGNMDELLIYVSEYYDSEVDYTVNNLVTLIEPILILCLGVMVLFMALGIFMPMWSMMRLFKGG